MNPGELLERVKANEEALIDEFNHEKVETDSPTPVEKQEDLAKGEFDKWVDTLNKLKEQDEKKG